MKKQECNDLKEPKKNEQLVEKIKYPLFRGFLRRFIPALLQILFGMRFIGEENLQLKGAALIVSNHLSLFDIPAVFWKIKPWVYFLAKKELFIKPFSRLVLEWWKAVPIDRQNPSIGAIKRVMNLLKHGQVVAIFPEGTRVKDPSKRKFHPPRDGVTHFADKLQVPIIPLCIKGKFRLFGRVNVICGKPFYLAKQNEFEENLKSLPNHSSDMTVKYTKKDKKVKHKHETKKEQLASSNQIRRIDILMDYIYALGDDPTLAPPTCLISKQIGQ